MVTSRTVSLAEGSSDCVAEPSVHLGDDVGLCLCASLCWSHLFVCTVLMRVTTFKFVIGNQKKRILRIF